MLLVSLVIQSSKKECSDIRKLKEIQECWRAIENWNVNRKLIYGHDLKTKVIEQNWKYETCEYIFYCCNVQFYYGNTDIGTVPSCFFYPP
jgi:hypothetical protein